MQLLFFNEEYMKINNCPMNIKKIRHLVLLSGIMLFWNLNMDAQDPGTVTIDSEKTVDAEQNDQWKSGDNPYPARPRDMWERSEEHTSELQSRGHLVCRLLLEKKNTKSIKQLLAAIKT